MASLDCCPVCRSRDVAFYIQDNERRLERCAHCDAVFVNPQPSNQDLATLYGAGYFVGLEEKTTGYTDYPGMRNELRDIAKERFKLLRRLHPAPGILLDVGTATGEFLEVAQEAGWQIHGIEISEFASRIAWQRNLPVMQGTLQAVAMQPDSFDVVTMWDVLEHVSDPIDEMRRVHRSLREGGYVIIGTPNRRSLRARLSGRRWWAYYVSREHLHYFAPRSLRLLLHQTDFHPVLQYTYALDVSLTMIKQLLTFQGKEALITPPPIQHVPRSVWDCVKNRLASVLGGHVLVLAGQKR